MTISHETVLALKAALQRAMGPPDGKNRVHDTSRIIAQLPVPMNIHEADAIVEIISLHFATVLGASILHHIEDHGGDECVARILDGHLSAVKQEVYEMVSDGCEFAEMKNPLEGSDHNAQLVEEILAELDEDGDNE